MTAARRPFVLLLVIALVLGVGLLAYDRFVTRPERERAEALALSEVLTATFTRVSVLKVATLSGEVRATGRDSRLGGWLRSEQRVVAPYSVDYLIQMKGLTAEDYRWDKARRRLEVRLPEVQSGPPSIDEARLRVVDRKGVFITASAMDAMRRQTSTGMQAVAHAAAQRPANLTKARDNARIVFADLLKGPLIASGQPDVEVVVRFASERDGTHEPWDESRSIADVLRDR